MKYLEILLNKISFYQLFIIKTYDNVQFSYCNVHLLLLCISYQKTFLQQVKQVKNKLEIIRKSLKAQLTSVSGIRAFKIAE